MEYGGIPRSFAVEYVVLGFLLEHPMHGYELRDRLTAGLGSLWRIATSQLYSVLHRLEERHWVCCDIEPQEDRPTRKVYRVTAAGEKAFWAWAVSPVRHLRDVRVEFLAKLYLLRRLAPHRVADLVTAEIGALHQLAERLNRPERIESDDSAFGRLALEFRRSQVAGTLSWLHAYARDFEPVKEEE